MIKIQQYKEEINSNGGNILLGALLQLKSWEIFRAFCQKRHLSHEIFWRLVLDFWQKRYIVTSEGRSYSE
jgi:hypothetical protein